MTAIRAHRLEPDTPTDRVGHILTARYRSGSGLTRSDSYRTEVNGKTTIPGLYSSQTNSPYHSPINSSTVTGISILYSRWAVSNTETPHATRPAHLLPPPRHPFTRLYKFCANLHLPSPTSTKSTRPLIVREKPATTPLKLLLINTVATTAYNEPFANMIKSVKLPNSEAHIASLDLPRINLTDLEWRAFEAAIFEFDPPVQISRYAGRTPTATTGTAFLVSTIPHLTRRGRCPTRRSSARHVKLRYRPLPPLLCHHQRRRMEGSDGGSNLLVGSTLRVAASTQARCRWRRLPS